MPGPERALFVTAGLLDCDAPDLLCGLLTSAVQITRFHYREAAALLRDLLRDPAAMERMEIGSGAFCPWGRSAPCLTMRQLGPKRWAAVCALSQQLHSLGLLRVKTGGINVAASWGALAADTQELRQQLLRMLAGALVATARAHPALASAQVQVMLPVLMRDATVGRS